MIGNANEPDIYDKITVLVDSLHNWSEHSPPPFPTSLTDYSILDYFPDAKIYPVDSSESYLIRLPTYMELLSTSIIVSDTNLIKNGLAPDWTVPVTVLDSVLVIDNYSIKSIFPLVNNFAIAELISNQLVILRTVGLPEQIQPQRFDDEQPMVNVLVRGRDSNEIIFTKSSWYDAVRQLAHGMQVYAGVLDISGNFNEVIINYYLLITYPNAQGHHFIEWREHFNYALGQWQIEKINITFTPYIPTDNLTKLFSSPKESNRTPIQLRLNR